jgi:hypothetical protein
MVLDSVYSGVASVTARQMYILPLNQSPNINKTVNFYN